MRLRELMFGKGSRDFYKSIAALVIPITIQNFISNAVNTADVIMLGMVGQSELSAVSLANQFQFLLGGFFFGISSGITIMASQYWGKKDTDAIQSIMGIALKISFIVTALVTLGALFLPQQMMGIYTNDANLIEIGAKYLRIIGISYLISAFTQVYLCTLRSVERAKTSTIISFIALGTNVCLNAVFIFGLLGVPKMGIVGVAIATTIARVIEMVLCFVDMAWNKTIAFRIRKIFGHHKLLFMDFLRYSIPALMNDVSWTVAFSMYSAIMGRMNDDVVAASAVATTVRDLASVVCMALASGASVLLGIEIGEGRMEHAKRDASRCCYLTLGVGALTGLLIILAKPLIFQCFELTDRAYEYLAIMILISGYYVIGQAINTLVIAGIFRAGGDAKFGMICDTITMWGVSVPLGILSAFVFKLPPMVVYFILCMDEFWKIPVVYKHYKKYGWLKDITREVKD